MRTIRFVKVCKASRNVSLVTKTHWGGRVIEDVDLLRRARAILITGAHHSGKSKILHQLHDKAEEIWWHQCKPYNPTCNLKVVAAGGKPVAKTKEEAMNWQFPDPVFLPGIDPISKWQAHDGVQAWWEERNPDTPWKKVPAWRRPELLADYLRDTRAVLFIDDAHKLTGRKLRIATACFHAAFRCVITADDENRIPPSLRMPLLDCGPQIIRLKSETAYDATNIFVWIMVILAFAMGSHELAMMLGAFQLLGGGRRAGKQD